MSKSKSEAAANKNPQAIYIAFRKEKKPSCSSASFGISDCHNEFERLLLEAIDEGLSSLGDSTKQAIYYRLERLFGIEREDISYNVEAFTGAVEIIFGQGADFLEALFMKKLHEKSGLNVKEENR